MAAAWPRGSVSVLLEEAQQMTGTIHVADDQGDTTLFVAPRLAGG
jgi:hypothetical protein